MYIFLREEGRGLVNRLGGVRLKRLFLGIKTQGIVRGPSSPSFRPV
jgi:hypothetical protein